MTVTVRAGTVDAAVQYNGIDYVRVDSKGMYLTPDTYPKFKANLSALTTITTSATPQLVPLNLVELNYLSCYNATAATAILNGRSVPANAFFPIKAGYYMITASSMVYNASGITIAATYVYKNGIANLYGTDVTVTTASTTQISSVHGMIYMNGTTDYIQLYCMAIFAAGVGYFYTGTSGNSNGTWTNFMSANLVVNT